ncbi:MAG: hypothetical protein H0V49_02375 [Nocardioidaceae bacterium]|nr:hypothetical protein [Nocardioidaceae bacterium]
MPDTLSSSPKACAQRTSGRAAHTPSGQARPLSDRLAAAGLSPGPAGLPTVNRSVTLDEDLDRELALHFARGDRSRFLNAAARDALVRLRVAERLAHLEAERGPISGDIRAEIADLPRPS